jgi:hypothetical protein
LLLNIATLVSVKLAQPSTLHSRYLVKYVAWIYENHRYKNFLISALTEIHINIFMSLFNHDSDKAVFILVKRMWNLLNLSLDFLKKYTKRELQRIYILSEYVSIEDLISVITFCYLDKVTKYNIKDIIRYLHEYNDFKNGNNIVEWGPGNHDDIETNVVEHYNKHILSDEGIHWKERLEEINMMAYKNYATTMFKKMDKIVIHSNGKLTYMSGFYDKIFIVGRYDKGVFGISSCYYVPSGEKLGRYIDECIKMS